MRNIFIKKTIKRLETTAFNLEAKKQKVLIRKLV